MRNSVSKIAKGMVPLLVWVMFLSSLASAQNFTLFEMVESTVKRGYGDMYSSDLASFKKTGLYDRMQEIFEQGREVEVGKGQKGKKSMRIKVPNLASIYKVLLEAQSKTGTALPAYYGFVLSRIVPPSANIAFAKAYATPMAKRLEKNGFCEGKIWQGDIHALFRTQYADALEAYSKVETDKKCKRFSREIALKKARVEYFIKKEKEK